LTSTEKATYDDLVTNFIKELITERGSCIFDRNYGTTFYEDLGQVVNIYKVRDAVQNASNQIKDKYGIVTVDVEDANYTSHDGFMNVRIKVFFSDVAVDTYMNFMYEGNFTDKNIIEIG
jgi:hypothetical protein